MIFLIILGNPEITPNLISFHRLLPKHDSAYIDVKKIKSTIESSRSRHISVAKIVEEYNTNNPSDQKFKKTTIYNAMKKKLRIRFRKTTVKHAKLNTNENRINRLLFIKAFARCLFLDKVIYYVDESPFFLKNKNFRTWQSPLIENTPFSDANREKTNLTLVCSREKIIFYEFQRENVNSETFIEFSAKLQEFLANGEKHSMVLYLDNATSHTSEITRNFLFANKLNVIFSAPYKSEYNLSEYVFRRVKQKYYKENFQLL